MKYANCVIVYLIVYTGKICLVALPGCGLLLLIEENVLHCASFLLTQRGFVQVLPYVQSEAGYMQGS